MIFKTKALGYCFVRRLTLVRVDILTELGADQAQYDDRHELLASYSMRIRRQIGQVIVNSLLLLAALLLIARRLRLTVERYCRARVVRKRLIARGHRGQLLCLELNLLRRLIELVEVFQQAAQLRLPYLYQVSAAARSDALKLALQ